MKIRIRRKKIPLNEINWKGLAGRGKKLANRVLRRGAGAAKGALGGGTFARAELRFEELIEKYTKVLGELNLDSGAMKGSHPALPPLPSADPSTSFFDKARQEDKNFVSYIDSNGRWAWADKRRMNAERFNDMKKDAERARQLAGISSKPDDATKATRAFEKKEEEKKEEEQSTAIPLEGTEEREKLDQAVLPLKQVVSFFLSLSPALESPEESGKFNELLGMLQEKIPEFLIGDLSKRSTPTRSSALAADAESKRQEKAEKDLHQAKEQKEKIEDELQQVEFAQRRQHLDTEKKKKAFNADKENEELQLAHEQAVYNLRRLSKQLADTLTAQEKIQAAVEKAELEVEDYGDDPYTADDSAQSSSTPANDSDDGDDLFVSPPGDDDLFSDLMSYDDGHRLSDADRSDPHEPPEETSGRHAESDQDESPTRVRPNVHDARRQRPTELVDATDAAGSDATAPATPVGVMSEPERYELKTLKGRIEEADRLLSDPNGSSAEAHRLYSTVAGRYIKLKQFELGAALYYGKITKIFKDRNLYGKAAENEYRAAREFFKAGNLTKAREATSSALEDNTRSRSSEGEDQYPFFETEELKQWSKELAREEKKEQRNESQYRNFISDLQEHRDNQMQKTINKWQLLAGIRKQ
jgi:hypothetical protein